MDIFALGIANGNSIFLKFFVILFEGNLIAKVSKLLWRNAKFLNFFLTTKVIGPDKFLK